jgi:hypothetical protein
VFKRFIHSEALLRIERLNRLISLCITLRRGATLTKVFDKKSMASEDACGKRVGNALRLRMGSARM